MGMFVPISMVLPRCETTNLVVFDLHHFDLLEQGCANSGGFGACCSSAFGSGKDGSRTTPAKILFRCSVLARRLRNIGMSLFEIDSMAECHAIWTVECGIEACDAQCPRCEIG